MRFEPIHRGNAWSLWRYKLLEYRLTELIRKTAHGTKPFADGRRRAWPFGDLSADAMCSNARILRFRISAVLESRRAFGWHVQGWKRSSSLCVWMELRRQKHESSKTSLLEIAAVFVIKKTFVF